MFTICLGNYSLILQDRGQPPTADQYAKRAAVNDYFETSDVHADWCYVAVSHAKRTTWPFLTVTQRFSPSTAGFDPGVILIPETNRLFIGAGERLLAYDLETPRRLWEDIADTGFWCWTRHDDTIVMSAELELAAWDLRGKKLWSTFVEPPWDYDVSDGTLNLDVMGVKSHFDLNAGPKRGGTEPIRR